MSDLYRRANPDEVSVHDHSEVWFGHAEECDRPVLYSGKCGTARMVEVDEVEAVLGEALESEAALRFELSEAERQLRDLEAAYQSLYESSLDLAVLLVRATEDNGNRVSLLDVLSMLEPEGLKDE